MIRPDTFHEFTYIKSAAEAIRTHRVDESLEVFGTVQFGIEMMRDLIEISREVAGEIDASIWWSMVPEAYRDDVARVVERVTGELVLRGRKLDQQALYLFVAELNDAIWRDITPR